MKANENADASGGREDRSTKTPANPDNAQKMKPSVPDDASNRNTINADTGVNTDEKRRMNPGSQGMQKDQKSSSEDTSNSESDDEQEEELDVEDEENTTGEPASQKPEVDAPGSMARDSKLSSPQNENDSGDSNKAQRK